MDYSEVSVKDSDVIVVRYRLGKDTVSDVRELHKMLQKEFSDKKVIIIPQEFDFDIINKEKTIKQLEEIIKDIKGE